jgi:hypothetical protein
MNAKLKLITPEMTRVLTDRLSCISSVSQLDQPGEPQAATISNSLADLEDSFRTMLDTLLPRLLNESLTPEKLNDALLDVGEELRHVLYHIRDPKYFNYLFDDGDA